MGECRGLGTGGMSKRKTQGTRDMSGNRGTVGEHGVVKSGEVWEPDVKGKRLTPRDVCELLETSGNLRNVSKRLVTRRTSPDRGNVCHRSRGTSVNSGNVGQRGQRHTKHGRKKRQNIPNLSKLQFRNFRYLSHPENHPELGHDVTICIFYKKRQLTRTLSLAVQCLIKIGRECDRIRSIYFFATAFKARKHRYKE